MLKNIFWIPISTCAYNKRRRERGGEKQRERGGRKEWVKSWVGISLESYSPLMCDEWLCGRCEIGSIKMPHFSSGVWRLSKHHLRYQHISPALLDSTHWENSNKHSYEITSLLELDWFMKVTIRGSFQSLHNRTRCFNPNIQHHLAELGSQLCALVESVWSGL